MERSEAEAIYEQGREAVVAVLLALSAQIAAQEVQIAKLTARVAELERRLNRNSHNSSMPPSQDPPGAPERRRAPSSKRSQGAQPGHSGHGRRLAPIEALDELIDHWGLDEQHGRGRGVLQRRNLLGYLWRQKVQREQRGPSTPAP
jgi:ribosomal protein S15P/S13E